MSEVVNKVNYNETEQKIEKLEKHERMIIIIFSP